MQLVLFIFLGIAGQVLHILLELTARMRAQLNNDNPDDDVFSWRIWWKRNGLLSLISIVIVALAITCIYFVTDYSTISIWAARALALGIGYAGDSGIKNVFKGYTPKE